MRARIRSMTRADRGAGTSAPPAPTVASASARSCSAPSHSPVAMPRRYRCRLSGSPSWWPSNAPRVCSQSYTDCSRVRTGSRGAAGPGRRVAAARSSTSWRSRSASMASAASRSAATWRPCSASSSGVRSRCSVAARVRMSSAAVRAAARCSRSWSSRSGIGAPRAFPTKLVGNDTPDAVGRETAASSSVSARPVLSSRGCWMEPSKTTSKTERATIVTRKEVRHDRVPPQDRTRHNSRRSSSAPPSPAPCLASGGYCLGPLVDVHLRRVRRWTRPLVRGAADFRALRGL